MGLKNRREAGLCEPHKMDQPKQMRTSLGTTPQFSPRCDPAREPRNDSKDHGAEPVVVQRFVEQGYLLAAEVGERARVHRQDRGLLRRRASISPTIGKVEASFAFVDRSKRVTSAATRSGSEARVTNSTSTRVARARL